MGGDLLGILTPKESLPYLVLIEILGQKTFHRIRTEFKIKINTLSKVLVLGKEVNF
ncbi:hypothetical protein BHECKSOX_2128 [Bathymodiolus heckerae thiotrophic gill symbiont]|nr:hypothetical protein BHECKSOX_2128 [Bathymodiolus heckerae thiotrophic gill symbiont]